MDRPSFDQIYMELARLMARRSTCARAHVGAVVTSFDSQRVLAVGYNGSYRGGPNECDSSTPGNCGCLHAEDNCLLKMDFNDPVEKKIYVTNFPCRSCSKRIVNAGIKHLIYDQEYRDMSGLTILVHADIRVSKGDLSLNQDRVAGAL